MKKFIIFITLISTICSMAACSNTQPITESNVQNSIVESEVTTSDEVSTETVEQQDTITTDSIKTDGDNVVINTENSDVTVSKTEDGTEVATIKSDDGTEVKVAVKKDENGNTIVDKSKIVDDSGNVQKSDNKTDVKTDVKVDDKGNVTITRETSKPVESSKSSTSKSTELSKPTESSNTKTTPTKKIAAETEENSNIIEATSINLNNTSLTLEVGETATLTATVSPSNATDKTVIWKSTNSSIVTVNNGKIIAIKKGNATITASTNCNCKEAICKVTVKAKEQPKPSTVEVTSIKLNKTTITAKETDSELPLLIATISPSNATNKTVTWTSSDNSVASVNNGSITPHKAGTITITAKSNNGKTATCKVTITHEHNWKTVYKTVHHDEVGHYENVDKGYTENIYYKCICANDWPYDEYGNYDDGMGESGHVVTDWVSLTPMGTCTPWYTILIHNGRITNDDILNCKYDWITRKEEKVGNNINIYYNINTNPDSSNFPESWFRECQNYYGSTTYKTIFIKSVYHENWQKVWVVDKAAYDEKVVDHYECSCGATK